MSLRKHLEHFAQNTSMHGFGRVILTKKPEKRAAWVIVFLSAWALFAYQLTSVLTKYFEYSKKTTTEFVSGGAPFPAITLCNMQSLDFYAMHNFMKAIEGFNLSSNDSMADYVGENDSFAFYVGVLYDLFEKYEHEEKTEGKFDLKELYKLYSRTTIATNIPDRVLKEIGVKQEEFIVTCTFGHSKCNFTAIPHSYYISCFKFEPPNSKNTTSKEFQSLSEGIENGFSVTLFTGTKLIDPTKFTKAWIPGVFEKGSPLSGSSGIRVVIHPPGTEPFPLTEGYDVPPGYLASLGIIPARRDRLGRPYGYCARRNRYEKDYIDEINDTDSEQNEPYRKISCERMCMQEHVIDECNCFEESLPDMGDTSCSDDNICTYYDKNETESNSDVDIESSDVDHDVTNDTQLRKSYIQTCKSVANFQKCVLQDDDSCNASVVADMLQRIRCADEVINRLMTDLTLLARCKCYPPCEEYRYDVSYSLAKWPSYGYEGGSVYYDIFDDEKFLDRFPGEKREMYKEYVDREGMFAMKDFAKINVYVTDSNVLHTIEEPATVMTQLISEIGGQLGLWIGVSVITISEVIETILTIATAGCRKLYYKFKAKQPGSASDPSVSL